MVSNDWPESLRSAWVELARHPVQARQFRTRRLLPTLNLDVHAGLRAVDDAPCLLIETAVPLTALFEVGGMRLGTYPGDGAPLLVLSLEDPGRTDLFTTVCADVVQSAVEAPEEEVLPYFLARLEAWRRFLKERQSGLSRMETVGLIGELLVMQRILEHDARLQMSWLSPEDGLHDFVWRGHALEVKASLGPVTTVHISTLDQLDTGGLRRLDLMHVRLIEAPDGRTLEDLIGDIRQALPDDAARRAFDNSLLRRGLMPDDVAARVSPSVQLRALTAYGVQGGFPKLVRSSVPLAVIEANYALELRAIEAHAVEAEIILAEFAGGTVS